MTDHEKRNGVEAERAKLEKERERLEQEREKIEKLQEEMEARIERQEERLEEMENELDAREEELDGREEELEGLEVEGAEGIREVLDVVSERIPSLMRGIQETVYSAENLKKTSDALVGFFKNLVDAGMDEDEAAEMTKLQMMFIQSQGHLTASPSQRGIRTRRARPPRPARPADPAEPAEPARPAEPAKPADSA
jgi:chromosome segregation ATPase